MAEPQQETWLKLVVLTVIILAAAAGLSAYRSSVYATQVQIFAAREARQWQDYQVESVKKENFGINRDILASMRLPKASWSRAKSPWPRGSRNTKTKWAA